MSIFDRWYTFHVKLICIRVWCQLFLIHQAGAAISFAQNISKDLSYEYYETSKWFVVSNRDQQWIDFSLFINNHIILSMNKSIVLKFNYSDSFLLTTTLIYKYSLQWVWIQHWEQTHNIRNIFDSYTYSFRFKNLENYS